LDKKNRCFFFGSNLADPTTGLELDQTDFMYNSQVRSVLGKKKKNWPILGLIFVSGRKFQPNPCPHTGRVVGVYGLRVAYSLILTVLR